MGLVEYDYSYMKNYALLSSFFLLPVINQPLKHFLERWSSKCITHVLRIGSKSVFVHICAIFFCCFGPISKLYGEIVSSCLQRNKLACIPLQHNTRSATPTHTYTHKSTDIKGCPQYKLACETSVILIMRRFHQTMMAISFPGNFCLKLALHKPVVKNSNI